MAESKQDPAAQVADRADAARLVVALLGSALMGLGAGLHYLPLGPLVAGAVMVGVALIGALRAR